MPLDGTRRHSGGNADDVSPRLDRSAAVYPGAHQLHRPGHAVLRGNAHRQGVPAIAGASGLPVLVIPLDLHALPVADGTACRSVRRKAGGRVWPCHMVRSDCGDRACGQLSRPVDVAAGHGSGRGLKQPGRRAGDPGMDPGRRARFGQCGLQQRLLCGPGDLRLGGRPDHRAVWMARAVLHRRRHRGALASVLAGLVRPAGACVLARRDRAGQDPGRAQHCADRDRRHRPEARPGTAPRQRHHALGSGPHPGLQRLLPVSLPDLAAELPPAEQGPDPGEDGDVRCHPVCGGSRAVHRDRQAQRPLPARRRRRRETPLRHRRCHDPRLNHPSRADGRQRRADTGAYLALAHRHRRHHLDELRAAERSVAGPAGMSDWPWRSSSSGATCSG